jgi:hypothetical protein
MSGPVFPIMKEKDSKWRAMTAAGAADLDYWMKSAIFERLPQTPTPKDIPYGGHYPGGLLRGMYQLLLGTGRPRLEPAVALRVSFSATLIFQPVLSKDPL